MGGKDIMPNDLEIYNRDASTWWTPGSRLYSLSYFNPPRFSYFDRFVLDWKGMKVLDVGCGGGFTSEFMAKKGAVVSGIDLSHASIEEARRHAASSELEIDYRHGPAEEIPYQDGTFDAVVCVDVLEHVRNVEKVILEVHRVLRDGGLFLFDTINKTPKSKIVMVWLLERLQRRVPKGAHDWRLFIRPERLAGMLRNAGFEDLDIKGFDVKGPDKDSGGFRVQINENKSVMYIGKCMKRLPRTMDSSPGCM
jgi:2-polyprenyl-6-hydroxyphenyl methylase/3-demethylubiquinone-9 3-methyltransferase